jgi:multisubunit Na+/H+ antiporter MnhB subunit
MKKGFRIATIAYLTVLASTLGASLFADAISAPIIFNSQKWLGENLLSHYQEGLIMTRNFLILGKVILLNIVAIFLYEGYKYKMFERDRIDMAAALVAIMSAMLFNYYYMPDIVNMQLAGEAMSKSETFRNIHLGSELDLKLFCFSIFVLIVSNMRKACR